VHTTLVYIYTRHGSAVSLPDITPADMDDFINDLCLAIGRPALRHGSVVDVWDALQPHWNEIFVLFS
jgi:hypothetical protein